MGLPRRSGDDRGPGSLVDAGRTVSMRVRLLGLRLEGAGDATGLCCVKMMRGQQSAGGRRAYGLREDSEGVRGSRGSGASASQLAA